MFLNLGSYQVGTNIRRIISKGKVEYGTEDRQRDFILNRLYNYHISTVSSASINDVKYPILAVMSNMCAFSSEKQLYPEFFIFETYSNT